MKTPDMKYTQLQKRKEVAGENLKYEATKYIYDFKRVKT